MFGSRIFMNNDDGYFPLVGLHNSITRVLALLRMSVYVHTMCACVWSGNENQFFIFIQKEKKKKSPEDFRTVGAGSQTKEEAGE